VRLAPGVNGKPRLLDSQICFNLSRSYNAVVIAVGERAQVGVDIERRDATSVDPGVVGWVLSANEHARWQELDSAARCDAFFRAWTRKEALLKGTGEGLNTPMSSIEVLEIADGRPSAGPITVRRGSASWTIVDLFDDPDYAAALAYLLVPGD